MTEPAASRPSAAPIPSGAGSRRAAVGSPAIRFALASLATGLGLLTTYGLFVLTETGQRLENLALAGASLRAADARQGSLAQLSLISVLAFFLAILAVVAVAFLRRRPGYGLAIGFAMGASAVAAQVLKEVLPRPELVEGPAWLLRNDFPSGHATIAAAVGLGVLLVSPERLRWLLLPLGAGYAALIGQATQVAGWHRLSAGLGGVLLAMTVMAATVAVVSARGLVSRSDSGRIHRRLRRLLWLLPLGTFVVAGIVAALLVAFPLLRTPRGADSVFVHTLLELAGIGLTLLAFLAFAALVEPFTLGRTAPPPAAVEHDDPGAAAPTPAGHD